MKMAQDIELHRKCSRCTFFDEVWIEFFCYSSSEIGWIGIFLIAYPPPAPVQTPILKFEVRCVHLNGYCLLHLFVSLKK